MFTQPASHNRFNLLLLSEGEQYFNDYSAVFYPNSATDTESVQRSVKGRLKVCSKSIFFDPEDVSIPIVRYDYSNVLEVEPLRTGLIAQLNNGETFYVKTTRTVQMKENNMIRPYVFANGEVLHRFAIKYVSTKVMLEDVKRFWSISRLPYEDRDEKLRRILVQREMKVSFDLTWMESLDERTLLETLANKITPLVSNAGRLLITNKMLYFQPLNNVAAVPVEKLALRDCVRVVKRRHQLRPLAIEIFYEDLSSTSHSDSSTTSAFFTFRDTQDRDKVFDTLTNLPGMTRLEHENQTQTTWKWQCGLISNFDYLMYLNSLAHRSFNDLTQYPVFPWILADYKSKTLDLNDPKTFRDLSKPIGALNPERLTSFRKRYTETPDDQAKFMYGTHYSTPAYVLYYLVRIAPEYMLKLQNGRFDEAERLFNSIEDTWKNVLVNTADLKELIPEFFSSQLAGRMGGEFLCNHEDINFGRRADGTPVGDVSLPPWASSASEFVRLHREALESDYVSSHIHQWIDLIFGYKQRGNEALKADNLFHPLTYEGAVDIEKERDPVRRDAILIQISEFGQTPARIFDQPHPVRFTADERRRMQASSGISTGASSSLSQAASSSSQTVSSSYNASNSSHATPTTSLHAVQTGFQPRATSSLSSLSSSLSGSASSLPIYSPTSSQSSLPSYNTPAPLNSSFQSMPPFNDRPLATSSPLMQTPTRTFGSSTTSLNTGYGSPWRQDSGYSAASESSATYELKSTQMVSTMPDPSIEQMLGALGRLSSSPDIILTDRHLEALENSISSQHSKPSISLTTASSSSSTRPIGGHADEWSQISRLLPSETWKSHRQGVTSICLSSDGETLYSVSQDSSLKIYSLGEGKQLRSNNISQLALSSCALSKDQKFVAIGSWDNNIYLYSNDYGRVITTVPAHDDTVSCLTLRDNLLVSGSWDTSMKVWSISPSGISQDPLMELSCLDSTVRAVHLNMDMNLALCGSDDGMLAIADIRSGSVVRTWVAHDDAISAAQFTSDGRIISVSASGTMKVHESTGKTMFEVDVPDSFHCLATNGTRLLTGDAGSTLRSWDLLVGEEIARVKRTPESPITCIATSEFCEFVITGSEDGTLTKWTKN